MKKTQEFNLIRYLSEYNNYRLALIGNDLQLSRDDGKVIIIISNDDDNNIVLKEFDILLSGNSVYISYHFSPETGHNTMFVVNEMPAWGYQEGGSPITFNVYSFIKFLEELNQGSIPAPLAGYLLPPLMPS